MNKSPLQIGVTGGIGTGKSMVCAIFQALGIPIYNADLRAKWVMTNDELLKNSLISEFGSESYLEGGNINRNFISSLVFNDKGKLAKLNSIVHPRVAHDYNLWVGINTDHHYLIKEAALLYESGSYQQLNKIAVVTAPEELRIKRVLLRDSHRSEKELRDIIAKQMPENEKLERADFQLQNDENELLIPQVLKLHNEILDIKKN